MLAQEIRHENDGKHIVTYNRQHINIYFFSPVNLNFPRHDSIANLVIDILLKRGTSFFLRTVIALGDPNLVTSALSALWYLGRLFFTTIWTRWIAPHLRQEKLLMLPPRRKPRGVICNGIRDISALMHRSKDRYRRPINTSSILEIWYPNTSTFSNTPMRVTHPCTHTNMSTPPFELTIYS